MNALAPATDVVAAAPSVAAVRLSMLRDAIFEMLEPVEHDSAAARHCLSNDDDVGARYHLKRVVECVKAAAATFKELEALLGEREAA
jgi:hypothetical protein